jgi:hypothetical protein
MSAQRVLYAIVPALIFVSSAWGQSISCADAFGNPVPVINAPIPDIGQATIYAGRPVILFNPLYARGLPTDVVTFFLYHECGHHALGHTLGAGFPLTNEQAADCWAARTLVGSGQFDEDDIRTVQAAIAQFGRADWTHLPGPMRAMNLPRCLASSQSREANASRDSTDDSDRAETAAKTCTVSDSEIEDADVSDEFAEAVKSRSAEAVQRALGNARSELRDDIAECRKDLERMRRYPSDRYWSREVDDDRSKIAEMRATISALEDRLNDLQ